MKNEQLASALYTVYCDAVGGLAYNGDLLPTWKEFAADPAKEKQVAAWRHVAGVAVNLILDPTSEDQATEAVDSVAAFIGIRRNEPSSPDRADAGDLARRFALRILAGVSSSDVCPLCHKPHWDQPDV